MHLLKVAYSKKYSYVKMNCVKKLKEGKKRAARHQLSILGRISLREKPQESPNRQQLWEAAAKPGFGVLQSTQVSKSAPASASHYPTYEPTLLNLFGGRNEAIIGVHSCHPPLGPRSCGDKLQSSSLSTRTTRFQCRRLPNIITKMYGTCIWKSRTMCIGNRHLLQSRRQLPWLRAGKFFKLHRGYILWLLKLYNRQ